MDSQKITADQHFQQAEHNFRVAEHLRTTAIEKTRSGKALDWSCTVAYYSAIHYFECLLKVATPTLTHRKKQAKISCIEDCIKEFCDPTRRKTKHIMRLEVIKENYPQFDAKWTFLHETADNARYNCYKVSPEKAKTALAYLGSLRQLIRTIFPTPPSTTEVEAAPQ